MVVVVVVVPVAVPVVVPVVAVAACTRPRGVDAALRLVVPVPVPRCTPRGVDAARALPLLVVP